MSAARWRLHALCAPINRPGMRSPIILSALFLWPIAGSCSGGTNERSRAAPFDATLGAVSFRVPESGVYSHARLHTLPSGQPTMITFDLCPQRGPRRLRRPGCDALDVMSVQDAVRVIVQAPLPRAHFASARERPTAAEPNLRHRAPILLEIPKPRHTRGAPLDYLVTRLSNRPLSSNLLTTDQGWPIATCSRFKQAPTRWCTVAFKVTNLYIEASWTTAADAGMDQDGLWIIASETDAKVRSLMVRKS